MFSPLLLAPRPGDPSEDGLLETWEMMQLDLHANLAVLSACETARGAIHDGEGVIGMSWAVSVAGTSSTIVAMSEQSGPVYKVNGSQQISEFSDPSGYNSYNGFVHIGEYQGLAELNGTLYAATVYIPQSTPHTGNAYVVKFTPWFPFVQGRAGWRPPFPALRARLEEEPNPKPQPIV